MKTYVLMISQRFPATHKRAGELTYFPGQILDEIKIHTIRANYDLWAKRIDEINLDYAKLSVRVWNGKPYRSKQREIFSFTRVGIEKLEFGKKLFDCKLINGQYCYYSEEEVAKNDGLSLDDFEEWFKDYDLTKPMVIIHFTNFRYNGST